jgi:rhodanese-related sulfurtransferase
VEIEGLTMQNIPLNDLRAAVHEGSLVGGNGATYVVSCKTGQRAYYASRVLSQLGYR